MKNIDTATHTRGESIYVDDVPERADTLFAAVFASPLAHGRLVSLNHEEVSCRPGVHAVLTARDISGENQIGGIFPDEPLLADGEVHYQGQPLAVVLAEDETRARAAVAVMEARIEPLPVVVDPREARAQGMLIMPPRTFAIGNVDEAFRRCQHVFEGMAESGGQEHLYIETQGAYAEPAEGGGVRVYSSTQGPTSVQRTVARVLGLPMHRVEVDVTRLGGGFGGKEDQATAWAVMAALGAVLTKRAVKLVLHRLDDMRMTGKRHPYSSDFKIGLDKDYRILAYQVTFHQNAGAAADLSPAVLERTLFHATNSYFIANVQATAYSCRTNLPPNTAFRGFGGPQGMFVVEAAIAKAAEQLGIAAAVIQGKNLLRDGDAFPYGQHVRDSQARASWSKAAEHHRWAELRGQVGDFNAANRAVKKGMAIMPVCFGISFTKTSLNQASALVHVYHDGSVGISTAAVEMGQGVNTKMLQVAQRVFSIASSRIKIETTNTTRAANTPPTAASASADLNGKALEKACRAILGRLRALAADTLRAEPDNVHLRDERVVVGNEVTELTWPELVMSAFLERVSLSEQAHYATPTVHFNPKTEKGEPFAYHTFGTAAVVAAVDCVRGRYEIETVRVVHDFGKSFSPLVDKGQAEGGIVQGIGWMTMEEVIYDDEGRLLSNALSTYKIPDIYSAPRELDVHFLDAPGSPLAIFKSKAIGEPPLMYGIGAYFAIRNAVRAFNPEVEMPFSAPITPEKVLMALYAQPANKTSAQSLPDDAATVRN